ncbi:MAG: ATP-dependent DNA ligase [Promethearchaeota archaeon]
MLFKNLCTYLFRIEKTAKRLEMIAIFQELFKEDLFEDGQPIHSKIIAFCRGKLYPDWFGFPELNMAKKLAVKAVSHSIGLQPTKIYELLNKSGDLGRTIAFLKKKRKQSTLFGSEKPLLVGELYSLLVKIAERSGTDSQSKKIRILTGLFARCSPIEARYVGRFIESKMRLGMGDLSMIEAIARLKGGGGGGSGEKQKDYRVVIERAFNIFPDLGHVIQLLMTKGIEPLKEMKPTFGIPIRSMLAQRLESIDDFMKTHDGPFAAEYKLDGERIQIHKKQNDVVFFSRRQENITKQFPDVVNYIRTFIRVDETILDGEVVAVDPDTGALEKFQVLMQRKRKHGIDQMTKQVPVRIYLFDIMMHEGISTLDMPYLERRELVEKSIIQEGNDGKIVAVEQRIINSTDELVTFFHQSIEDGTEGLVTKSIKESSVYQPGARGWLWIKLKSMHGGKLPDNLDLVVIGAIWGEGRRGGAYGSLLLAARDDRTGELPMVTRISSGMSDELSAFFMNELEVTESKPKNVVSKEKPDVWFVPRLVIEITGDEITSSEQSTIGYSVRFPRILRVREEKGIEDISTVSEIIQLA